MTRLGSPETVRLSIKDWVGIITSVTTVLIAIMGVYLHHDRLLITIGTRQEQIIDRLDRVEDLVDRQRRTP